MSKSCNGVSIFFLFIAMNVPVGDPLFVATLNLGKVSACQFQSNGQINRTVLQIRTWLESLPNLHILALTEVKAQTVCTHVKTMLDAIFGRQFDTSIDPIVTGEYMTFLVDTSLMPAGAALQSLVHREVNCPKPFARMSTIFDTSSYGDRANIYLLHAYRPAYHRHRDFWNAISEYFEESRPCIVLGDMNLSPRQVQEMMGPDFSNIMRHSVPGVPTSLGNAPHAIDQIWYDAGKFSCQRCSVVGTQAEMIAANVDHCLIFAELVRLPDQEEADDMNSDSDSVAALMRSSLSVGPSAAIESSESPSDDSRVVPR